MVVIQLKKRICFLLLGLFGILQCWTFFRYLTGSHAGGPYNFYIADLVEKAAGGVARKML